MKKRAEKKPERVLGSMEPPVTAKARVLEDDDVERMIAEREEAESK